MICRNKLLPVMISIALAFSMIGTTAFANEGDHSGSASEPEGVAEVPSQSPSADGEQTGAAENSWRYQDGKLMEEPTPLRYLRSAPLARSARAAWSWTSEGYVSSDGSIIQGAKRKGIDVSEHQGNIDWDAVKNDGIGFAIIRCGYGNDNKGQDDKYWLRNVSECERLGIPYGVYIYSYAYNVSMASSEADHTLRLLKGHHPTYPVYYDLEENRMADVANRELLAQMAQTFCNKVSAAGYEPGVYANLNWWNNYLTDSVFDRWTRWVAQYNSTCDYEGRYRIWQATSNGSVSGISGHVDLNFDFTGWELIEGTWYWYDENLVAVTGWNVIGGSWYYFDSSGAMQTGWLNQGGTWYHLSSSGVMDSGWLHLGGTWYWLDPASGAMGTSWLHRGGTWYWLDPTSGAMATGWTKATDGLWYFFDSSGAMQTGWLSRGGGWYWLTSSGAMGTGWLHRGGTWYWLDPNSGVMATGWAKATDGLWYFFDSSGAMQTGWLSRGGGWYWLTSSGAMGTGWLNRGGTWYWLDPTSGVMATGWAKATDGLWYFFDSSGAMQTGWLSRGGGWYWLTSSGAMGTGWLHRGGTWYWLDPDSGVMATGLVVLDGVSYQFDSSGACLNP